MSLEPSYGGQGGQNYRVDLTPASPKGEEPGQEPATKGIC